MTDPAQLYSEIQSEASKVLIGQEEPIRRLTVSLLTRSHVLLEGVPGVAKTTLANVFARTSGLHSRRIQMTPDLLPADVTGTRIYREDAGEFELERGPIFSNLVIADEINRATPKTQSALLEAMQETQVTIEGETLSLPSPFMVIATQNPIEMEGTFGLPEAQRDRFQFKITVDLPERDDEAQILDRFNYEPKLGPEDIDTVVTPNDILAAREAVSDVHVSPAVRDYILDIIDETRDSPDVEYGVSTRGALALQQASKAQAAINGRHYVIPDDVKELAVPALAHRLVLGTDAEIGGISTETVVEDLVSTISPPSTADLQQPSAAVGDGGQTTDE
ncbi:AAA family ATPase [Haloferax sp. S1W]|uniref:AAA family ATPase n=1 Tax=Haloferax sp. S1W TaxID=3377110 RepID=UPI0037C93260